ncbi:MAG TPA: hypothetical protein VGG20_14235 [Thermoanaerobaculia bacterium]
MKKQMKKLVLNRETVVNLEKDLGRVIGGVTMNPAVCDTSGFYTCQTFVRTCAATYLC